MNMATQKHWMLRPIPLVRRCVALALLSVAASPAPSFSQGTLEQRMACTPDVLRLCSAFIPNAYHITACLIEKNAELSDACRTVLGPVMNPLPSVSDDTAFHKRTAR